MTGHRSKQKTLLPCGVCACCGAEPAFTQAVGFRLAEGKFFCGQQCWLAWVIRETGQRIAQDLQTERES